jgi:hypothetical protein
LSPSGNGDRGQLVFRFDGSDQREQIVLSGAAVHLQVERWELECNSLPSLHTGCPGGVGRQRKFLVTAARCEPFALCTAHLDDRQSPPRGTGVRVVGGTPGTGKLIIVGKIDEEHVRTEDSVPLTVDALPDRLELRPELAGGSRLPVGAQLGLSASAFAGDKEVAQQAQAAQVRGEGVVTVMVEPLKPLGGRRDTIIRITGVQPGAAEVVVSIPGHERVVKLLVTPVTRSRLTIQRCVDGNCTPVEGEVRCHPGEELRIEVSIVGLDGGPRWPMFYVRAAPMRLDAASHRAPHRGICPSQRGPFDVTLKVDGETAISRRVIVE